MMAENSRIEWCDHTFNPWMGCTKVSPGCAHCYAEAMMDKRWGKVKWGPQGERVRTSEAMWMKPLKWNNETWRECLDCGRRGKVGEGEPFYMCWCDPTKRNTVPTRQRVFCASLADVGDHHPSVKYEWVEDLVELIAETPNLDWLLLTKRPDYMLARFGMYWGLEKWPDNVWVGVSVEDQIRANERIPILQTIPAVVRFVSVEPMLGWITPRLRGIDWVICGGESGKGCRQMDVEWARNLRDRCKYADVPFFMKQLGGHPNKRHLMSDLPEDLRIREFPESEER